MTAITHRHVGYVVASLLLAGLCFGSSSANATEYSAAAQFGYVGAPGGSFFLQASDFAEALPVHLRMGLDYQSRDAGDPLAARRIFINDNTNGVPEESGRAWGGRLDLVVPWSGAPLDNLYLFGGPRWSSFRANFKYIGGNEDFDVTSTQWGWGLGLEGRYPMGPRADFVLGAGADWYLEAELDGHDTAYSPDGEDINPRNDYGFGDADSAVNQPGLDLRLILGVQMRLGD